MKRLQYASLMLLAGLVACKDKKSDPNVLFILTDQWRSSAFGFAGDPNVQTPRLDKFASEAVRFNNAVSVCPVCTPFRGSLLTGRYPTSTGMFLNDAYLPEEELCLAEIFKANGYQTGYIGKWHLDGHGRLDFTPPERRQGFDYWKALECSHDYNHMPYYEDNDPEVKYWKDYSPFAVCEDAKQYLSTHAHDDSPMFLFVSIAAPHFPLYSAPEEFKSYYPIDAIQLNPNIPDTLQNKTKKDLQGYYAHCSAVDQAIGNLLDKVKNLGLWNKTVIFFTADHGDMMGAHGVNPKQKQVAWREAAGVPLLIRYPSGHKFKKQVYDMAVTTPDLSATLIDLCGIKRPESFEGVSFAQNIMKGRDDLDKGALYMSVAPFAAVRKEFKKEYRAIKTAEYTYVKSLDGPWLLYDDGKDPYQQNNLVSDPANKDLLNRMDTKLADELNRIHDDFKSAAAYNLEWGYTVESSGEIPYKAHNQEVQTPERKWHPLFNHDLSNVMDEEGVWHYEDQVLTASKDACIFTTEEYENFELDLEFKNEEGTNSGVIVYCTDRKNWIPNSVEIQISDDYYFKEEGWAPNWFCGGIFGHLPPTETLVKHPGEWNHMNILCEGRNIVVKLNGKVSADMDMAKWTSGSTNPDGTEIPSWLPTPFAELPTKGYIGFQGMHGKANIYFRNIRIAPL